MKRTYNKPEAKMIVVSSKLIRMVTKAGFIEVFWEELQSKRRENCKVTEKAVFDEMNESFLAVFGEFRYSSYDSFRQRLNK